MKLDSSAAVARGVHRIAASAAAARENGSPDDASAAAQSPRGVNARKVAEFSADVADAIARLEAIRQGLIDLRENRTIAREFAARTIARAAELDDRLASLSSRITTFQSRAAASRANCAELGRTIQWWVAFAAIAITLVLLWFAASQVGMMVHARRFAAASRTLRLPRAAGRGRRWVARMVAWACFARSRRPCPRRDGA